MYKLLLVSNRQEVQDAFASFEHWEALGFRPPRTTDSCDNAVACLNMHHADAVAVALPEAERIRLMKALEEWPYLPVMQASEDPAIITRNLQETEQVLSRIHVDYSNDRYDIREQMLMARHAYFRRFLAGYSDDEQAFRRKLKLLRSHMDPDKQCVLMHLQLDEMNDYMEVQWHYGVERLEVAIRNILRAEKHGVRMLLSMDGGKDAYLIACPMLGSEKMTPEELLAIAEEHVDNGIEHLREYLGLKIQKDRVVLLPCLYDLPEEAKKMRSGIA